jgi:Sulfotransferase family
VSLATIELSATELMTAAREETGVDIVDTELVERLERLIESLNREAGLTDAGAEAMQARLRRLLRNRLRMFRDLARCPEIEEQQVLAPVVLTSAPRTGSTKLHRMLAAGGDLLALQGWQGLTLALRTGDRGEDPQPRIRESEEYEAWFRGQAPAAMDIHEYATFEPDEDSLLLEHCLFGLYLSAFAFVPSYAQWFAVQERRGDLLFVKRCLQYLQWQFHNGDPRRWVLKCPGYFGLEAAVADVFPGAVFVTTNRDPRITMASTASLLAHYHQVYSDVDRRPLLGAMMAEGFAIATQQHMSARDADPELEASFIDIGYRELTGSAQEVVEKVYSHAGLRLSGEAKAAMGRWDAEQAADTRPVHKYSLEDYGLTPTLVETKFRVYMDRFREYLTPRGAET